MKRNHSSAVERELLAAPVGARDHIQGPANAAITLVEYGDYECRYCSVAFKTVKALQKKLGNRLCFVFRNFPLTNAHPYAEHAAEAAEAAGEQGRFWEMHDMLYENQDALDDQDLAALATRVGLDGRRVLEEVLSGAHRARIRADFMSGIRSGVNGTPTFFINGLRHDGSYDYEDLLEALVEAGNAEKE